MTATVRRLMLIADVRRARLAIAALLGVLTILFGVGLMGTAGYLISRAAEHPAILSLTAAIVGVRFFGLARPLARYLERLASHDVALRSLGRARARVYAAIEPLSPSQLEDTRRGDLLSRFVADVDSLQNLYVRGLEPPVIAGIAGSASVVLAGIFLPAAAVVLAAGLLLGGIVVPAAAASLSRRSVASQADARGAFSAEIVETLAGSAELVALGLERDRLHTIRRTDARLVRIARRAALTDGTGDGLRLLVTGATVVGVLAVSVSAHADGRLDRVVIALLALLSLAAFEAVQPLTEAFRELGATVAAGRRILELTDREPRIVDPADPLPAPDAPFTIVLENVRARYGPGERPALDDFSLRLEPGRRVVLLGRSGAGKTTVVRLLLRFLDPERGRVTLAGEDLRRYRQQDVRRLIAVAGQDAYLFSTSIRDNLRLACPEATDDELARALRSARILDWVRSLPNGLDTLIGEEGRELSGGQRQRIVVARALLTEAPVLVLDEPTAHLDPPTAKRLIEDVFHAARERTVLLITHRPEGIDLADEVVVLREPRP
ncbi:MAG TPA: thiol reductant ABC exporter subunit CydC [Gaiellaceae bacterium]|nr:thiol reductant ABC exporter subunit CydC [Gaiellaceae bacterium]